MIQIALPWSEAVLDLHHLTDIILLQMRHLGRFQLQNELVFYSRVFRWVSPTSLAHFAGVPLWFNHASA